MSTLKATGPANTRVVSTRLAAGVILSLAAVAGAACDAGSFVEPVGPDSEAVIAELRASRPSVVLNAVGQTAELSAVALDTSGNTVEGITFDWSSSKPSIATVDDMGIVTAKAAGLATLVVASAATTATDTVRVTVEALVSPPSEHELMYAEDFEGLGDGETVNGYHPSGSTFVWGVGSGANHVSSEMARSGSKSLRFNVPEGIQYNNEARFSLGRNVGPVVAMEFYLYYPDGTEGIPNVARFAHGDDPSQGDNDKFIRLWSREYTHSMGLHTDPAGPGRDDESIQVAWDPNDGVAGYYFPTGYGDFSRPWLQGNSDRGRWIQVRILFRDDTSGTGPEKFNGNGGLALWKDGVLVNEVSGLNFDDEKLPGFERGYFFGAANSGSPVNTAIYMDDLKIYDYDPGW